MYTLNKKSISHVHMVFRNAPEQTEQKTAGNMDMQPPASGSTDPNAHRDPQPNMAPLRVRAMV